MSRLRLATFRYFLIYHRPSDMYFAGWENGTTWRGLGGCSYMSIERARHFRVELLKLPQVDPSIQIVGVRRCRWHRSMRGRAHADRCRRLETLVIE